MQVFISHSYQDAELARKLAGSLRESGLRPWLAEDEVFPGDNWGEVTGKALSESDAMVALVTPVSGAAPQVRQDIAFALTRKAYANKVIPLIVGNRDDVPPNALPWIMNRYKMVEIPSGDQMPLAAEQIVGALRGHESMLETAA